MSLRYSDFFHTLENEEVYFLRLPFFVNPPRINQVLNIYNNRYRVKRIQAPEDFIKSQGIQVAKMMIRQGIGWFIDLEKIEMQHLAQIQKEFVRYAKMDTWTAYHSFENYIQGRKFISPKTRNLVDFYSLPRTMQRLIKSKFDKERDKTILHQIERVRNTQYGPQMAFA